MKLPDFLTEWPFGEIVIKGHRISLYHVIDSHQKGMNVEQLHEWYPPGGQRTENGLGSSAETR